MRNRNIYIPVNLATSAIASKENLEALSFAIAIKTKYMNSVFVNPSIRRIKEEFHIGTEKARRVLKNSIEYGYTYINSDGHLVSVRLKNKFQYHYQFKFKKYTNLKAIENAIRQTIIFNHLNKIADIKNTKNIASDDSGETSLSKIKKCSKKLSRMNFMNDGLSNMRAMTLTNSSRYLVRRAINSMLSEKTIKQIPRNIELSISAIDGEDYWTRNKNLCRQINEIRKNSNLAGYVWYDSMTSKLMLRTSNTYDVIVDKIQFIF